MYKALNDAQERYGNNHDIIFLKIEFTTKEAKYIVEFIGITEAFPSRHKREHKSGRLEPKSNSNYIERKKVIENLNIVNSRLYCAQIVGWVRASFDNIADERRLFDGFVN